MRLRRIKGVLLQEMYLTLHSLEMLVDVFIFPAVNIVIFGLISLYIAGGGASLAGQYVFLGMLLWQIVGIIAYSVAVGAMWNIWSRNLSNMFIAPLKIKEYVFALFASGCVKAIGLLALGMALSAWFFDFNVLEVGMTNLVLTFVVFGLFGLALSLVSLGLIFRFGTRLAALSWSMPWLFQPLSAAFFPIADLPPLLQYIAYVLPPTYAFEATRNGLTNQGVDWPLFAIGFALGLVYCALAIALFRALFRQSKDIGQFARNES